MRIILIQVFLATWVFFSGCAAFQLFRGSFSLQTLIFFGYGVGYAPTLVYGDSWVSVIENAPTNLWNELEKLHGSFRDVEGMLEKETAQFADAAEGIKAFKQNLRNLMSSTNALRIDINQAYGLKKRDVNFNFTLFTEQLSHHVDLVLADLMDKLTEPAPGNQTENSLIRNATISMVLNELEDAVVKVYALWDVPEVEARERFGHVKPHIRSVVLTIGNLADEHPVLVEILVFSVIGVIIPEVEAVWILRPLLRVFGFGPLGPAKGSLAAVMQKQFFGAAVKNGSWFAKLQSAAMKSSGIEVKVGAALSAAAAKVIDAFKHL